MLAAMTHNGGVILAVFVSFCDSLKNLLLDDLQAGALVGFLFFGVCGIHSLFVGPRLTSFAFL
jgi:hypothetical protein